MHGLENFGISALLVALAEMGDRTQLLTILLATRYRQPLTIIAGVFVATLANHALAALAGFYVSSFLDAPWFRYLIGASFIAMAGWVLIPDKESAEGEKNRFTIIPKDKNQQVIALNLDPFVQHGHVLELTGKTEVGARVMVNGREVPVVGSDGAFHYFTPPLAPGESIITITAQNAKGGVNTLQKKVEIQ